MSPVQRRAGARAHTALVAAIAVLVSVAPWSSRGDGAGLTHYVGALHEHSGFSDGAPGTTPATYFASAKGFGLDFLGSGEHSDNADVPSTFNEGCLSDQIALCAGPIPDGARKWDATLEQARAASDPSFTGFRGFEWTSDRFGHINVYFSRNDTNAKADGGYGVMETFWQWFTTRPELGGGADGIATFNHPDDKQLSDDDPTKNWNDLAYVPAADPRMVGIEVYNGTKAYDSWYVRALDRGWHVGAVGAEDAHEIDEQWGAPDMAKTVLIARDRSEGALREAMLARRMYAVQGGHNALRLSVEVGGEPMGARLARPAGQALPVTVGVSGDPEAARIELVTNGGAVAASADSTSLAGTITVTGDEAWYFVRVRDAAGKPIAYSSPVWVRAELDFAPVGEWVAGDLHIHTTYSHDSWGPHAGDDNTGPDEFYTLGHTVLDDFAIASSRGLDYLAITDHNDIRSQTDPGFGAFGVIPVAGYEGSFGGHAQMLGARACYAPAPVPGRQVDCNDGFPHDAATMTEVAANLRADGGVFQINHPADGDASHPLADWHEDYGFSVVPDTMEVWNISPLWQAPMPSGHSADDAIGYWEDFLDLGHHVGATGGSDNHWVSTTAVQGPGQPTTWVWVTERSERGVLEGLRAGRTTISWQPPAYGGPRLFLEADVDDDGVYESLVGDTIPADAAVRVRAEGAPPGSRIEVRSGCAGGDDECTSAVFAVCDDPLPSVGCPSEHVTPPDEVLVALDEDATWVRAELVLPDLADERAAACEEQLGDQTTYCRNRLLILALTSAIYVA